jgi:hypothetical protein
MTLEYCKVLYFKFKLFWHSPPLDHEFRQFKIEHFSADGEPGSNWGDRSIQTISGQVNQVKQNMFQEQSYRRNIFNIKWTGNEKHV